MFHDRGSGHISLLKYSGIIMDEELLIKAIIVAAVLFILLLIVAIRGITRTHKELSGKQGVYKGPAGEPQWNGQLPTRVDDYDKPRYVYENLVESTDYQSANGRIIGYRISPELVIHSRLQEGVNPPKLQDYIQRLGGKLMSPAEVLLLKENWQAVSALRERAGDKPLKVKKFWCQKDGYPYLVNLELEQLEDAIGYSDAFYPLILKR